MTEKFRSAQNVMNVSFFCSGDNIEGGDEGRGGAAEDEAERGVDAGDRGEGNGSLVQPLSLCPNLLLLGNVVISKFSYAHARSW